MKPYRPTTRPTNTQANRIRERYLHQLGLQRGSVPSQPQGAPQQQQVVVIGLPSLPEERATNEPPNNLQNQLQLESHDFTHKGDSSHTDSSMGSRRSGSSDGSHKRSRDYSGEGELNVPMTSLALSYPTALLKPPSNPSFEAGKGNSFTRWFATKNDRPQQWGDQDSVTSTATSTTAGSSFSTTMVSRDWGANNTPNTVVSATAGLSANSESAKVETQGVHFLRNACPTSSLAHALNRFNIDSDCDASACSASIMGGSIMTEEDDHMDEDDGSIHSHASYKSVGSHRSTQHGGTPRRPRKAGKAQRLLDRAAAHERILQIRNEQSQRNKALMVQAQRMGQVEGSVENRSRSSSISSQNSMTLVHVQYGPQPQQEHMPQAMHMSNQMPSLHQGDLSRTPTVSNCSDLWRKGQAPTGLNFSIPAGVHIHDAESADGVPGRPLGYHPQLANELPGTLHSVTAGFTTTCQAPSATVSGISTTATASTATTSGTSSTTQESILAHRRQASVDDVLEVVEALSKLKGKSTMIPRVR